MEDTCDDERGIQRQGPREVPHIVSSLIWTLEIGFPDVVFRICFFVCVGFLDFALAPLPKAFAPKSRIENPNYRI